MPAPFITQSVIGVMTPTPTHTLPDHGQGNMANYRIKELFWLRAVVSGCVSSYKTDPPIEGRRSVGEEVYGVEGADDSS